MFRTLEVPRPPKFWRRFAALLLSSRLSYKAVQTIELSLAEETASGRLMRFLQ